MYIICFTESYYVMREKCTCTSDIENRKEQFFDVRRGRFVDIGGTVDQLCLNNKVDIQFNALDVFLK